MERRFSLSPRSFMRVFIWSPKKLSISAKTSPVYSNKVAFFKSSDTPSSSRLILAAAWAVLSSGAAIFSGSGIGSGSGSGIGSGVGSSLSASRTTLQSSLSSLAHAQPGRVDIWEGSSGSVGNTFCTLLFTRSSSRGVISSGFTAPAVLIE